MNSEKSFFFPRSWAIEAPNVWDWVQENALHVEISVYRMGWNVWMPLSEVTNEQS